MLGSDYTDGVPGIGIVNATEVLQCFGSDLPGLSRFREWMWGTMPASELQPLEATFAHSHAKVKRVWEVLPHCWPE